MTNLDVHTKLENSTQCWKPTPTTPEPATTPDDDDDKIYHIIEIADGLGCSVPPDMQEEYAGTYVTLVEVFRKMNIQFMSLVYPKRDDDVPSETGSNSDVVRDRIIVAQYSLIYPLRDDELTGVSVGWR